MTNNKIIHEVFVLRSIACLSIVMLHAVHRIYGNESLWMQLLTILLTFGTPAFVFISELVIAKSYPDHTPLRFWKKRLQYILLPYLGFGLFYAFSKAMEGWLFNGASFLQAFATFSWRHLLIGDYHGYFIIIIFQFYLLHMFFQKFLIRFSAKRVLGFSFLINMMYLSFFHFTSAPASPVLQYIWSQGYWLPFLGWLFYFSVAFYCGRHYDAFIQGLMKRKTQVFVLTAISACIPLSLIATDLLTVHSSKRIDMVLFTTLMVFSLYIMAHQMKQIPKILVKISQYSFAIYLLHPFYMGMMIIVVSFVPLLQQSILGAAFMFFVSILLSMLTAFVLNKIPYGAYFIGKIGIGLKPRPKSTNFSTTELKTRSS